MSDHFGRELFCCRESSLRLINSLKSSIGYNSQKICSWSRRHKTIPEITKKHLYQVTNNQPINCKFFKEFTNHRKNISRAVVFRCKVYSVRYKDHRWDPSTIWKTRYLQTHIEDFSLYLWKIKLAFLHNHRWSRIKIRVFWRIKVCYDLFNQLGILRNTMQFQISSRIESR